MSSLNPQQRKAVQYIDRPLLVLAGAGSGKTGVITQKIIYLIQQCHIAPSKIVAVTFTNKAAREMKQRVAAHLDKQQLKRLNISTFHTLGLKIIRKEHQHLGFKSSLTIYDSHDCQQLLKQLASSSLLKALAIDRIQYQISRWKNAAVTPEQAISTYSNTGLEQDVAQLYGRYCHQLKIYNALDFDDLISLPTMLFEQHPDVLDKWQNKVRYMLVDEYQDTNEAQYKLVKLLVGARKALTVVGDDDQSIYAWRGAQPENLAQLKTDFPDLTIIKLEQNYRSSSCILKAANSMIDNNPHVFNKKLWSEQGFGEPIKIMQARNEEHEAEKVVSDLLNHKFQKRTQFRDYAILYRSNFQSRVFEKYLREQNIPYRITGGTSFFALTEIKDMLAYLRLLANSDDDQAFLRVVNTPRREIGPSTLEKLANYANQRNISLCEAGYELGLAEFLGERPIKRLRNFIEWVAHMEDRMKRGDIVDALRDLIEDITYKTWLEDICRDIPTAERKLENVYEFVDWVDQLLKSSDKMGLTDLVQQIMLIDILDNDEKADAADCVQLLTLHSAKGLEFPHVYIVGMEENLLPHRSSIEEENIEEERRLAYVGITRAQRSLVFSCASKRKRNGEILNCEPSRFLTELAKDTVRWENAANQDPEERQQLGKAHLANLRGLLTESA